jgi:hypothetical protein
MISGSLRGARGLVGVTNDLDATQASPAPYYQWRQTFPDFRGLAITRKLARMMRGDVLRTKASSGIGPQFLLPADLAAMGG